MNKSVLITNSVTKVFGKTKAVSSVNMKINKGDVYGFIGENGAGKTTIIRLITGLINPTKGDYTLFGINSKNKEIEKAKKRMSAVVETPSLYLNMNARDNLIQQCILLGINDYSCIDTILDTIGLSEQKKGKKHSKNYSLGMKQRLAIGIALVGNPDFIVLDEPMNGLDPEGIVEIRELIIKLNREDGITFLISSHILDELSKMATKYGFIHKGQLIRELTCAELNAESRKCIELVLSSTENIPVILDKHGLKEYTILSNSVVRIYGDIEINVLVSEIKKEKINIIRINYKDESVEEFYLNTMGGLKNA